MNLAELKERVDKNTAGSEVLAPKLEELEAKLQDSTVWSDQKLASEIGQQVREIKDKIESDMTYPGQIKVTVVRETRATEIAK